MKTKDIMKENVKGVSNLMSEIEPKPTIDKIEPKPKKSTLSEEDLETLLYPYDPTLFNERLSQIRAKL